MALQYKQRGQRFSALSKQSFWKSIEASMAFAKNGIRNDKSTWILRQKSGEKNSWNKKRDKNVISYRRGLPHVSVFA